MFTTWNYRPVASLFLRTIPTLLVVPVPNASTGIVLQERDVTDVARLRGKACNLCGSSLPDRKEAKLQCNSNIFPTKLH